jgi:uncharacterized delta-60 repeat protein
MSTRFRFLEALERRRLLAHVGLDLSFGAAGYAPVDASLLVAPLPGGKVLAVGESGAVRLNADGTVDTAFVDRGARSDVPRPPSMAVVAGQQLFVAGVMQNAPLEEGGTIDLIFVRKLNLKTGATNAGFGAGGVVAFQPVLAVAGARVDNVGPGSIIPTNDGGVIIAVTQHLRVGNYPNESFPKAIVLHKLDAAGKLDPTFGNKGVVTATLTESFDYLAGAHLAAYLDGRFVLIGGSENNATLQRFNANGSLDTTFGDQGVLPLDDGPFWNINVSFGRMIVQPDGKLVISLTSADISLDYSYGFVVRINADGTRDTSFGDAGTVTRGREEGSFNPPGIALDSFGRIVGIAGNAELYRLTPAGAQDPTFDDDGFTTIPQPPDDLAFPIRAHVAMDASGNVLLGGRMQVSRFADGQQRVDLGSDRVVHIDGTGGADTITASVAGDTLTVTINGEGSTFAAGGVGGFRVSAAGGDDRIDLSAADFAATIDGDEGNDSIVTGDGADRINCDDGDDTVDAGGGRDLVFGDDGHDSILAGAGDDRVYGEYGRDTIAGGDGNDNLFGGHTYVIEQGEYTSGNDGDDSIFGDAGNDRCYGQFGNDSVAGGTGNDNLYGGHTYVIEPHVYNGNDGDDSLSGNAGNDRCYGQMGNDRVAGNGGRDRLFGGESEDRIYGGASGDWLYGGDGGDQLFGEGGADRLYADDDESLDQADTLRGNAGDDVLISRDSSIDHLFGDGGRDSALVDASDLLTSIEIRL